MQHTVSQQCFLDTTLYLTLFYATNSFLNRARTAAKRHRDGCQAEAFVLWQRVAIGQPPQSAKVQTREDCQFLLSNDRGCTSDICGCALSMHTSDVWAGHLAYASQPHPQDVLAFHDIRENLHPAHTAKQAGVILLDEPNAILVCAQPREAPGSAERAGE